MSLADHEDTQRETLTLKKAFSVILVKLYGLSIAHIARQRHPYIESLPTLNTKIHYVS